MLLMCETTMVETCSSLSCSFCSSDRPSILGIFISVTTRSIWPFALRRQGFNAVAREQEPDRSASYFVAELLQDESLDVRAHRQRPGYALSCRTFDPRVDLAAKHHKINRLCQKRLSTTLQRLALRLRIAVGSDHDYRDVGSRRPRLGQQLEFAQSPGNLTQASQGLFDLISSGRLVMYPDPEIRLAASRAIAKEMPRGCWRIAKDQQSHKIDVIVALAMSAHAAVVNQLSCDWTRPGIWE
jgi:hypothetical protein